MQDEQKANEPPMQTLSEPRHAFFIRREGTCDEAFRTLQGRLKSPLKFEKRIFLYVPSQTNDSLPSWEQCCVDSLVLHNLLKYIQTEQCIYISLSHDKIMCNKSLNLAYIEQYLASV